MVDTRVSGYTHSIRSVSSLSNVDAEIKYVDTFTIIYVIDESQFYRYNGVTWDVFPLAIYPIGISASAVIPHATPGYLYFQDGLLIGYTPPA